MTGVERLAIYVTQPGHLTISLLQPYILNDGIPDISPKRLENIKESEDIKAIEKKKH